MLFRKKALAAEDDDHSPHSTEPVPLNMQGDIASNIRALRIKIVNWSYSWGPESLWEKRFNDEVRLARDRGGHRAVDHFFLEFEQHTNEGREIMYDLKFVAAVSCNSTHDEIRDLFLQGFEMVTAVTSEVKFFEVKLDEYAPSVPMTKVSDVRYYSGM